MDESFADRWSRKERDCGFGDIAFKMVACGPDVLPESAAPCVTFKEAARPVPVWDVFASPSAWSPPDRERLARYRMIGSDGAGNPICIEQGAGAVVLLDHEDWFRSRQFVNSSVRQLAECLLAYMGEQDLEQFKLAVALIDPAALGEKAFWWHEAAFLGT
jgi:SUKH-4 immunity protein